MSVKVLQLFHTYPLFFQPYIAPVVNLLSQAPDLDFEVLHFEGIGSTKATKLPKHHTRIFKDRYNRIFLKNKNTYLERYCLKSGIDVLHIMDSFLFDKVLHLLELPQDKRPKVIMTMRGGETYVKPLIFDKWKVFYKKYADKIDQYIVMSVNQKERLVQLGIDVNKIHVIPISLKSSFNASNKKMDTTCIRLVSAFRLLWVKNIDGNLRVIKSLKDKGFKVRYDLYGSGHMLTEALFLIHKYNIQDCVFIHGKLNNKALLNAFKSSDFYLQLSHSESLGMSVIEAQSVGLPAIVAHSGGLPETIAVGRSGYCVDAWDAEAAATYIINLWNQPERYQQFSKAGIAHCSEYFSNEVELQRLINLYKKLV